MIGWLGIVRLGLVQAAIGAMVMVSTAMLNRVMVVEYALAAAIPGALVGWHYAVQLSRPFWGHGSDRTARRTPWILGGMGVLALGTLLAVNTVIVLGVDSILGAAAAILGYTLIGAGVGAAGTSLLALLASAVSPERRPAAAAITWIMMVAGIALSAGIGGEYLKLYSPDRLALVTGLVVLIAFLLALVGVVGTEPRHPAPVAGIRTETSLGESLREIRRDPEAVRFTIFVFVSMLAYNMQDLILEPFAGLVFAMNPGQSTQLAGVQHGGVLLGMIVAGVGGSAFARRGGGDLMQWVVGGCIGSAFALGLLAASPIAPSAWPIALNTFLLGAMNGLFAVAAIGAMMRLAGSGKNSGAGIRMGVWGAAQAIAFGAGGFVGAVMADAARAAIGQDGAAFGLVFAVEGGLFLLAARLATRLANPLEIRGQQGGIGWSATTQS